MLLEAGKRRILLFLHLTDQAICRRRIAGPPPHAQVLNKLDLTWEAGSFRDSKRLHRSRNLGFILYSDALVFKEPGFLVREPF